MRCSNHQLEIEKGRHKNIIRQDRLCKVCPDRVIESEEHFMRKCTFYIRHRKKYQIDPDLSYETILKNVEPEQLGRYLFETFSDRKKFKEWFNLG